MAILSDWQLSQLHVWQLHGLKVSAWSRNWLMSNISLANESKVLMTVLMTLRFSWCEKEQINTCLEDKYSIRDWITHLKHVQSTIVEWIKIVLQNILIFFPNASQVKQSNQSDQTITITCCIYKCQKCRVSVTHRLTNRKFCVFL